MFKMNHSIFRKLLFSYVITVLLGLGVVGLLMSFFVTNYIYDSTRDELLRKALRVNSALQQIQDPNEMEKILHFLDESYNARIWVFDRSGQILTTSTMDEVSVGKEIHPSIVKKILQGEKAVNEMEFEGLSEPMLSVAVPWGVEQDIYGGIVLHAPIVGLNETVGNIRETILWATLIGVLVTTSMVSYLSWSISKPLRKIERTASEIGVGNYKERIDISSEDEIGDLAHTINTMAKKLEEVDERRERVDEIRNDFLANISHELRTPLTAMQGFLEALQDGLIPEDGKQRYYNVMYHETMHMNRLVGDITDLIKLENNEIDLTCLPVEVEPIIQKVAFSFEHKAKQKGNQIKLFIRSSLPNAYADPDRLEQMLNNLVNNAVKFTDDGIISIHADKDGGDILFIVSDTGKGISKEDQERIWERFFKVDRGRPKTNNGTGLGLSIVKELAELHHGRISLKSAPGKGAAFHIWIPSAEIREA